MKGLNSAAKFFSVRIEIASALTNIVALLVTGAILILAGEREQNYAYAIFGDHAHHLLGAIALGLAAFITLGIWRRDLWVLRLCGKAVSAGWWAILGVSFLTTPEGQHVLTGAAVYLGLVVGNLYAAWSVGYLDGGAKYR